MNPFPNPFTGLLDLLAGMGDAALSAAGWAWDTVTNGITTWMAKGFVLLLSYVWVAMDATTRPHPDAAWFSGTASAPYVLSAEIAVAVLVMMLLLAVIQGVLAGEPAALIRRFVFETPAAVAGIVFTVSFTVVLTALTDEFTNQIWTQTRGRAVAAIENMIKVAAIAPSATALPTIMFAVATLALLALWVVLLLRESLVYLVIALCPLAWALALWPKLKPVRGRVLEVLGGLIFSKVVIGLALAVGLGALGAVGSSAPTGGAATAGATGSGAAAELGTLLAGVITFATAAFMPYLVIKLLPVVEAAAIAQGVAHAPMRAGQQAMQYSYYARQTMNRLSSGGPSNSGGGPAGPAASSAASPGSGSAAASSGSGSGVSHLAGSGSGAAGSGAGGGAAGGGAAAVAGPAAVAVVAAQAVKQQATSTATQAASATGGSSS